MVVHRQKLSDDHYMNTSIVVFVLRHMCLVSEDVQLLYEKKKTIEQTFHIAHTFKKSEVFRKKRRIFSDQPNEKSYTGSE